MCEDAQQRILEVMRDAVHQRVPLPERCYRLLVKAGVLHGQRLQMRLMLDVPRDIRNGSDGAAELTHVVEERGRVDRDDAPCPLRRRNHVLYVVNGPAAPLHLRKRMVYGRERLAAERKANKAGVVIAQPGE